MSEMQTTIHFDVQVVIDTATFHRMREAIMYEGDAGTPPLTALEAFISEFCEQIRSIAPVIIDPIGAEPAILASHERTLHEFRPKFGRAVEVDF